MEKKTLLKTGYTNLSCNISIVIYIFFNMPVNPMNIIGHWQNAVVILEIDIYACSINFLPNSSFF